MSKPLPFEPVFVAIEIRPGVAPVYDNLTQRKDSPKVFVVLVIKEPYDSEMQSAVARATAELQTAGHTVIVLIADTLEFDRVKNRYPTGTFAEATPDGLRSMDDAVLNWK
jgi:hypothetical protein